MLSVLSNRIISLTRLSRQLFSEQGLLKQIRSDNDTIELIPKNHGKSNEKSKTLIWLHGLGDSAYGFLDLFNTEYSPLNLVSLIIENNYFNQKDTKVVLLTAPILRVTINDGMMMTAWYDIKNLERLEKNAYCYEDILNSADIIQRVVDKELKELKKEQNLFIGGFSQGCSMALHVGLESYTAFGGVFGFSGYLFNEANIHKIQQGLPVLLCHGKEDGMVPYESAMKSYERIKECKNVEIKVIDNLGHSICLEEIHFFREFYQSILKKQIEL